MSERGRSLELLFGGRYRRSGTSEEHHAYTLFRASRTDPQESQLEFLVLRIEGIEPEHQEKIRHYMARDLGALRGQIARPAELEFEEDQARAWLVFEAPWGASMSSVFAQQWPPAPEITEILNALSGTLNALHKQGIAAGDLHPDRLWYHRHNAGVLVTLVAPGLISMLQDLRWSSPRINAPPPLREMKYMPPERYEGRQAGPPADVWSLALLAFELYTSAPFWEAARSGETLLHLAKEVLLEPMPSPSERAPGTPRPGGLPDGFDGWFMRCTARKPEDRSSIQEAALFLEAPLGAPTSRLHIVEEDHLILANPKGSFYDDGLEDPGQTSPGGKNPYRDGPKPDNPPEIILANPKGSFYDDGLSGGLRWYRLLPVLFLLAAVLGTLYVFLVKHR